MGSVTFSASVGGDGSTVTDDGSTSTGLDGGGHRTRFVPCLAQTVAVAAYAVERAVWEQIGATADEDLEAFDVLAAWAAAWAAE